MQDSLRLHVDLEGFFFRASSRGFGGGGFVEVEVGEGTISDGEREGREILGDTSRLEN